MFSLIVLHKKLQKLHTMKPQPSSKEAAHKTSAKMHPFASFLLELQHLRSSMTRQKLLHLHMLLSVKLSSFAKRAAASVKSAYWFLVFQSNPLIAQLIYFMSISFAGFVAVKSLRPTAVAGSGPRDLDLLFTAVSTVTVSSMATVEMEQLSDAQLWVLVLLMLLGGEVFTSMLALHFHRERVGKEESVTRTGASVSRDVESSEAIDEDQKNLKRRALAVLACIVAGYFAAVIAFGSAAVIAYLSLGSGRHAGHLLQSRGLRAPTFAVFTAVSSFANCGFTPVNENMAAFRGDAALLLLLVPQVLAGNALFPPLLRASVWATGRVVACKREECGYLLRRPEEAGYRHLHDRRSSVCMAATVACLVLLQVVVLGALEWDAEALRGMGWFQKLAAALFQSANTRHAGESAVDISALAPPVLVLFVLMMYLPSNFTFLPIGEAAEPSTDGNEKACNRRRTIWKNLMIPKPASLAMFIMLACITERKSMSADPLNFNIFSIVFEVISAYGNVGYSLGYSCEKLLKPDATCKAASYGFVGRWSDEGRLIIIFVMFLGRLKKFGLNGTRAWRFL